MQTRPRGTWSKIAQQFWATGIWRAELIRRYGSQNSIRYFAPPLLVLGMGAPTAREVEGRTGTKEIPAPTVSAPPAPGKITPRTATEDICG